MLYTGHCWNHISLNLPVAEFKEQCWGVRKRNFLTNNVYDMNYIYLLASLFLSIKVNGKLCSIFLRMKSICVYRINGYSLLQQIKTSSNLYLISCNHSRMSWILLENCIPCFVKKTCGQVCGRDMPITRKPTLRLLLSSTVSMKRLRMRMKPLWRNLKPIVVLLLH